MARDLDDLDRSIVRAWSAIVSRGLAGSAREVAAYLSAPVDDVSDRMTEIRVTGQIPSHGLDVTP